MRLPNRQYWTLPALAVIAVAAGAYVLLRDDVKPAVKLVAQPDVRYAMLRPDAARPSPVAPMSAEPKVSPQISPQGEPPAAPVQPKADVAPTKPPKQRPPFTPAAPPVFAADVARDALVLVGTNSDANAVWAQAINDPNLSPHDRKDLIEDLNETGFADPKNLTPDDLPLIASRLAIIEQLAPNAMDDTNLAAFAEAYKDLSKMYARLNGP